jgi:hypothetical protein
MFDRLNKHLSVLLLNRFYPSKIQENQLPSVKPLNAVTGSIRYGAFP